MSDNRRIGRGLNEKKVDIKLIVGCSICFSLIIFAEAILQTASLSIFGIVPPITLAMICAIGFICGEKAGAVAGVITGALVDMLGGTDYSISPLMFMLCSYCCGVFVGWFLNKNLPSFLLYAAIAGILKEGYTFVYFIMFSSGFSPIKVILNIVIPEYAAFMLFVVPSFLIVWGIYRLFKGKDNKENKSY